MSAVLPIETALRRRTPAAARRAVTRRTPATARRAVVLPAPNERALARAFFPIVLLAIAADLATKALAVATLGGRAVELGGPFALHVVYNAGTLGGATLGADTRALNFLSTGIVVGLLTMLVPTLARLGRGSLLAVALLVGGALGNMVSLATSGPGVPDFFAIASGGGEWVANVADAEMVVGFALLARTVGIIVGSLVRGARGDDRTVLSLASSRRAS